MKIIGIGVDIVENDRIKKATKPEKKVKKAPKIEYPKSRSGATYYPISPI